MSDGNPHQDLEALRRAAHRAHRDGDDRALQDYARYLAQVPDDASIWSNLGALHRSKGRYLAALRAQARAQVLQPEDAALRNNYANILSDLGQYDESIAHREWILEQRPDDISQKAMIGRCLRGQGRYEQAITYLTGAIADHPEDTELQMQLAFAQLGAGRYRDGFETYRIRWQTAEMKPRDLPYPQWAGEPLDGKTVLVMPEQGFGDAIMFARFVPSLQAAGARVLYLVEKPVAPLFEGLDGAEWVGTGLPKSTPVDYWMNMMDMPLVHFGQTDAVPPPARLHVPDDSVTRARQIVGPHVDLIKIGVVWTGSVTYKGNKFRSFRHTDLLPLIDLPGVQLFSLYKGPELTSYYADGTDAFIIDAGATEAHFGDSAAMMQQMDLVITSDTATLHLAGSLGVPCWGVLHWDPFWVWRHAGDSSEWYPGVRLFRQKTALDWAPVIKEVRATVIAECEGPA